MMKRILIITVTAGNGHNACARAMKAELEKQGNVQVEIVDLLKKFSTKLNVWICDKGYSLAVAKLPKAYEYFYEKYKNADPYDRYVCAAQGVANSALKGLLKYILTFKPDVIYCTHFYGAIALTNLKFLYRLPCKCIAANLDYVNSPFWEAGVGVDYLALPNEDFIDEFLFEGYLREQLLTVGLPVDGRSLNNYGKCEARKKLGLDEDVFTLLIMFGGGMWKGGFGIFKNALKALDDNTQIIVINGKDKKGFKKIEKIKRKSELKIINVGFTNDVPLYLACADLAICKLGGTGATEMINAGLPMLVTENLPAQEKHNLYYLKNKGAVLSFNGEYELKEKLSFLKNNPEVLKAMTENAKALKRNAAQELAKFMLSQTNADYRNFNVTDSEIKTIKKRVKKALKLAYIKERNYDLYPSY